MSFPLRTKLKAYFITGILTIFPLVIIILIFTLLFKIFDKFIAVPILNLLPPLDGGLKFIGKIISFFLLILLILGVGAFSANVFGKKIMKFFEEFFVLRVPLVNWLYTNAKQLCEFLFIKKTNMFAKAVLVEYPRKGIYSVGFITSDNAAKLKEATQKEIVTVYVPTALNLASGFLIIVPKDDIIFLDLPKEDALKLVITGGVLAPSTGKR